MDAAAQKRKRADQEEEPAPDGLDVLDLRAAKRLLLGFERKLRDNLEARMKHPEDPSRFADSELALHAETDRLRLLAGAPELFPDLVPLGLASSLSSLLTHENADLAAAAASLLADLTDSDVSRTRYTVGRGPLLRGARAWETTGGGYIRLNKASEEGIENRTCCSRATFPFSLFFFSPRFSSSVSKLCRINDLELFGVSPLARIVTGRSRHR